MLCFLAQVTLAQFKPLDALPDLHFSTLLNAPDRELKLKQLKGQVVLIEFWATWCGSCVQAMPHLEALQSKYKGKLQVITVTDEPEKRINLYLNAKPSNLWFAIDTGRTLAKTFPHQLLPHTVVIDIEGNLVANTSPEDVTAGAIDSLINGLPIALRRKQDDISATPDELVETMFPVNPRLKQRFLMQPAIKGAPSFSRSYRADSVWQGRRITAINCSLSTLYRMAYGDISYNRVLDQTGKANESELYCLDIIVDKPEDPQSSLRKALAERFDLHASFTTEMKKVKVLKIADRQKFHQLKPNTNGFRTYYSRHGEINQQAITMVNFAEYLEDFGFENTLIVDETGTSEKYDIVFSFEPENPKSLPNILADMGLALVDEQRPVQILVIGKQP